MEHCCLRVCRGTDYTIAAAPLRATDVKTARPRGRGTPIKGGVACTVTRGADGRGRTSHKCWALGVRHFRVELLTKPPEQGCARPSRNIASFHAGNNEGNSMRAIMARVEMMNQLGVTRGQRVGVAG